MDNAFMNDVSEQIDEMNENELKAYISHLEDSINDPYDGRTDLAREIALTRLKNRAMDRMSVFKREMLRV